MKASLSRSKKYRVKSTTSLLSCPACHPNIWSPHTASWNMATIHATVPIILWYQSTGRGVSLSSLSLPLTSLWWQTPERSPLLVIELTSFSKYQEPCWIIKMCLYWGTYFWQKPNSSMHRKQSYACWIRLERRKRFVFSFPDFSLVKIFSPCCLNYSGRVALCGAWIAWTLVISTREPVITQTALLPSSHASSTLQAWQPVNVSVVGCLSSSLIHFLTYKRKVEYSLSKKTKWEKRPSMSTYLR